MSTEPPALDEASLSGDAGSAHLFRWLCNTEQFIKSSAPEEIKHHQSQLEAALIKVITSPDPYPQPGRPLRNVLTKCLLLLYSRGESRTLYDTLQTCLRLVGDYKVTDKDVQKTAAFYVIGELMNVHSSQVMSLMNEVAGVALKTFKSSVTPLVRHAAFTMLRKSLPGGRRAVTEQTMKDIVKHAKNGLTDKSLPAQRAAADLLSVIYDPSVASITQSDIESVVGLCIRSLEGADQVTRICLSRLAGQFLAASQIEQVISVIEPARKTKKDTADVDEDAPGTIPPPTEVKKALMTLPEMLSHLSTAYNKPQSSRRLRIGVFNFYAALFTSLGPEFVQSHYSAILGHFMTEIVSHPRNNASRYDKLLARRLTGVVLRDLISVQLLGEQAQASAIQDLTSIYLRRWPALMPGQTAPNPQVLVAALIEVTGLVQQLGCLPQNTQDSLLDPLITLLGHPQHTVRVHSAWALRCFCFAAPARLPHALISILDLIQRDLSALATPAASAETSCKALGHAYGLAAAIAVVSERPLYVSYDITTRVLDVAIQLLKRAGDHDLKIAATEVEVAWMLISALMTLGPNFVRTQLPQLLVLWRNALPKPTSKDSASASTRSAGEWMFLLHVRESALGAILSFLVHNQQALVTLDVARRITSLLSHALSFANIFVSHPVEEPNPEQMPVNRTLHSREASLRRRIHKCFSVIGLSSVTDATQTSLLQSALNLFASPDGYVGSSMQAAIASSAGTVTSIWQSTDGYAYGVAQPESYSSTLFEASAEGEQNRAANDSVQDELNDLHSVPVLCSLEHDPLAVCMTQASTSYRGSPVLPPATAVVNSAIELFGLLLPFQDASSVSRTLRQMADSIKSPKLEKNMGRKMAVLVNATIALQRYLHEINSTGRGREALQDNQANELIVGILMEGAMLNDVLPRIAASDSLGVLAGLSGTTQLSSIIKNLVDRVVNNRDPYGRAGCASAFGSIFRHVGGLTAGPLLKTATNVLLSLSYDPHPVVHYWALKALALVIDASSLAFAPFVTTTLSMVFKVYASDTHEPEGGTSHNANLAGDLPANQACCLVIDAVINVLGPDMQELSTAQTLALNLAREMFNEDDEGVRVEALKCIQHIIMFAPELVSVTELVDQLRDQLGSPRRPLKVAALNALYQLVQNDALTMSKVGGDPLAEQLFLMLDSDPSIDSVRSVITSWLKQTAIHNPSAWINLCLRVMVGSGSKLGRQKAAGASQDDEAESLNVAAGITNTQPASRWRTQLFALQCLHSICSIVSNSSRREHIDIPFAQKQGIPTTLLLVSRVSDLIKIAFTASASHVLDIRLEGLVVLRDIIEIFRQSPDPDYEEALLLEQHQAPITAALTPAFSSDSSPEVLASAVEACAVFVGSGIVKDVSKMGRILKLLTSVLQQSQAAGTITIGEAGELSPNASVMLRVATLSAWAKLQIASEEKKYLIDVLSPHRSALASLWVAALRDFATLRTESDTTEQDSSLLVMESGASHLGRDVLLPYYNEAWAVLLHAVAIAMQTNETHILAAMDGREVPTSRSEDEKMPVPLFFVLYGLAFEALTNSSVESVADVAVSRRNVAIALRALRSLVKPIYAGATLSSGPLFEELITLFYRLTLTEPSASLIGLVDAVRDLASVRTSETGTDMTLTPSSTPQTQCLQLLLFIIRNTMQNIPSGTQESNLDQRIQLIIASFNAYMVLIERYSESQKSSLQAVALTLYSETFRPDFHNPDMTISLLPALKSLLTPIANVSTYSTTVHAFLSQCITNIDGLSGRAGQNTNKKLQANLLAIVLAFSVSGAVASFSLEVLERACTIISNHIKSQSNEVSLAAAQCAKTIISASASAAALQPCILYLLPGIIGELVSRSGSPSDANILHATAIGTELWQSLLLIQSIISQEKRQQWHMVLLPTIVQIINLDGGQNQTSLRAHALDHIVSVASTDPVGFKASLEQLKTEDQHLLQEALRNRLGQKLNVSQASTKPQISLRAF